MTIQNWLSRMLRPKVGVVPNIRPQFLSIKILVCHLPADSLKVSITDARCHCIAFKNVEVAILLSCWARSTVVMVLSRRACGSLCLYWCPNRRAWCAKYMLLLCMIAENIQEKKLPILGKELSLYSYSTNIFPNDWYHLSNNFLFQPSFWNTKGNKKIAL